MTIKRKIERIFALTMEISPPDVKYKGEEKPVVLFSYSGHCQCLSVQVFENGWKYDTLGSYSKAFDVYSLYDKKHAKEVHQQLDEIILYLEKMKAKLYIILKS